MLSGEIALLILLYMENVVTRYSIVLSVIQRCRFNLGVVNVISLSKTRSAAE